MEEDAPCSSCQEARHYASHGDTLISCYDDGCSCRTGGAVAAGASSRSSTDVQHRCIVRLTAVAGVSAGDSYALVAARTKVLNSKITL
jgi:hypothetical protein